MARPGALLLLLAAVCCCATSRVEAAGAAQSDGLFIVYMDEGTLQSESGAPVRQDRPNNTYISMQHVLLTGQPLPNVAPPAGEVEERQCAAACRAASGCNVFYWCPQPTGCSINLADSSADGGWLAFRHCALRQQPSALPDSAQPIKASRKGQGSVSVTSGQLLAQAPTEELPGYNLTLGMGFVNMYDYVCNGTINPKVCIRKGSLQDAYQQCEADGVKCMGIKWFPLGRDYLGPGVFVLKGIPDSPTPQTLPGVPINLSLANWNGAVQFYAKDLTAEELAEASFYMTWLGSADGSSSSSGGLSAGAIAGIAVGSAVAVAAAAAAAFFIVQRRRRTPVTDAEAAIRVLKDADHPCSLSSKDLTGAASGPDTKRSVTGTGTGTGTGKGSPTSSYLGSLSDLSRATSADALALELGKEWMVDVSQLKFVLDKDGNPTRLGAGSQGVVYKAMLNGCEPVAVKVVPLAGGMRPGGSAGGGSAGTLPAAFLHEARMLHGLRHRCIVQLAGVALTKAQDKALLIMELLPGGDLFKALNLRDRSGGRVFGWHRKGKRVALDVASALAFLHNRRVMHFDVKAGNVMLTRDLNGKLGDVGLSKAMTHTFASQQGGVGTFSWCAPEVLQGKPCSFPADIYSFGVLLWEVVTGDVPLRGRMAPPSVPDECPQGVVDLINRCMEEDPAARPTANQLVEELCALMGLNMPSDSSLLPGEAGLERAASGAPSSAGEARSLPQLAPAGPQQPAADAVPAPAGPMLQQPAAVAAQAPAVLMPQQPAADGVAPTGCNAPRLPRSPFET